MPNITTNHAITYTTFSRGCLLVKMASKTVTRSISVDT